MPFDKAEIFQLLTGQRLVLGIVEEIRSQEIQVNIGDVMPRLVSMKQAGDKHLTTPRIGDVLVLVINNQNNVLEYHVYGEERWHVLMHGELVKSLAEDQPWALIQDRTGKITITPIDSDARQKLAALPLGQEATFLIDASHTIIDLSWENKKDTIVYP